MLTQPTKTHALHLTSHVCIGFIACVKKEKKKKKRKLLSTILYTIVYTRDVPGVAYGSHSYDIPPITEVHECVSCLLEW